MASVYQARWANAKKVWGKFQTLIKLGYTIFDEDGEKVENFVIKKDGCYVMYNEGRVGIMWFLNDTELDNGMMTPIKAWNDQFALWTYIHPLDTKLISDYLKA